MDNICHTLVGAALGEAGLKRHSRLAMPALLLGANIPDLDVLAYLKGPVSALGFRRGWTHGPLGLLVLPFILAAVLVAAERTARWVRRRRGREPSDGPSAVWPVFAVSLAAVLTHPVLDFLNSYGVRWLLPFDRSWYYGDTLFIVDPWVWGMLALGVIWSRRTRRTLPAGVALLAVTAYIGLMGGLTVIARHTVSGEMERTGIPVTRLMATAVPANPLRREVLVESGDNYEFGSFDLAANPAFRGSARVIPKNDQDPAALAAAATPAAQVFLSWSRFPYYLIDEKRGVVRIMDARYNADWASLTVNAAGPR